MNPPITRQTFIYLQAAEASDTGLELISTFHKDFADTLVDQGLMKSQSAESLRDPDAVIYTCTEAGFAMIDAYQQWQEDQERESYEFIGEAYLQRKEAEKAAARRKQLKAAAISFFLTLGFLVLLANI